MKSVSWKDYRYILCNETCIWIKTFELSFLFFQRILTGVISRIQHIALSTKEFGNLAFTNNVHDFFFILVFVKFIH